MEANINISGRLSIDEDDLERVKKMSAEELLRALVLANAEIKVKVTELYQKKEA